MSTPSAYDIIRAYGCMAPTVAEQRAYVGVLDRMGAFATSERVTLGEEGFLGETGAQESDRPVAHNPEHDDPAQAQGNRVRAT